MKRTLRKILRFAVPALAFLFQLWRGFRPYRPEPGFIPSGGAPSQWRSGSPLSWPPWRPGPQWSYWPASV